jgi:hypothetical protein
MKFIFIPFSIAGGFLAALIAKKSFEQIWGWVDDQEPPDAEHREVSYPKLVAALAIEGAIFRLARGFFDHGARRTFARATGRWPGEPEPEPE